MRRLRSEPRTRLCIHSISRPRKMGNVIQHDQSIYCDWRRNIWDKICGVLSELNSICIKLNALRHGLKE